MGSPVYPALLFTATLAFWCNDTAGAFVTGTKAGISASLAILGYRIVRDAKLFSDLPLAFLLKQLLLPDTIIVHNNDPRFDAFPFVELRLIQ